MGKLHEKFINSYSKKNGRLTIIKLPITLPGSKGVALVKEREAWDVAISAYPYAKNGYDDYFNLSTQDTDVRLNCSIESYDICNKSIKIEGKSITLTS